MIKFLKLAGAAALAAIIASPAALAAAQHPGGGGGAGHAIGGGGGGGGIALFNGGGGGGGIKHFNGGGGVGVGIKHFNGGGQAFVPHNAHPGGFVNHNLSHVPGKPFAEYNGEGKHVFNHRDHDDDGDHDGRRHHHNRFVVIGSPFYDNYYDDYGYGYASNGDCGYYWQRYLRSGNLKWKYRYYECIE